MNAKNFLHHALLLGGAVALALLWRRQLGRASSAPVPIKLSNRCPAYAALDAYIEQQMRRLNIPGASLAVVEGDQIVHLRGFGRARPGGGAPTPQMPFFIGSLTKSFTALAIMQLVEKGVVALDAPVQRYLPWFRLADPQASAQGDLRAQITVRHLLNQTSGLPVLPGMASLVDFDNRPGALERQVRALSALRLKRPVGSKFEYSNLNYNVLGLIVEAASGESYADYIQSHIFNPLEMHHSYTSKEAAERNGLAAGYRLWFGFPIPVRNLPVPAGALPSGQLIASAEDMAHYLIAQLNAGRYCGRQIVSEAGIDEMHQPAAEINEMSLALGSYGMGWISLVTGKSRIVSHTGDVPDFAAFMAIIPEQKKGLVLLLNANNAMLKMTLDEMGQGAAERLAGEVPSPTHFDAAPWIMRGLLLIPALQLIDVVATLRQLRRWRRDPQSRPRRGLWMRHILLPLVPNLLAALTLLPMLTYLRGFITVFMPDYSWIARISGGFAIGWSFLRTHLFLRAMREQ
jgi:CubicO group peptidase (beta-lactamase class C family)